MDNGLIFPYPRVRVPGEAGETNHPPAGVVSSEARWWGAWDLIL
jgi:hypothetical protein